MPIRSRTIQEKINELSNRKAQFQTELESARLQLETIQNAVIKGLSDTDALVSAQIRVNTIEQTITRFDSNIAALEADLIKQKASERKKAIISEIKTLDGEAEKTGARFLKLYSDIESLSYARFAEMSAILSKIEDLKLSFSKHISALVPEVQKLKSRDLPEVQTELDNLLEELKTDCKLNVLRSEKLFSDRAYVTDDFHAFRLPQNDLSEWIFLSIRVVREREKAKQQVPLPEVETTGFLSKIFG